MNNSQIQVLVVDDENIMRECLKDILTDQGYQVIAVSNGNDALKSIAQNSFHIVISDIRMPGINGEEVLKNSLLHNPSCKVILITAYSMDLSGKSYLNQGAFGFILKPFDIDQIRSLVSQAAQTL